AVRARRDGPQPGHTTRPPRVAASPASCALRAANAVARADFVRSGAASRSTHRYAVERHRRSERRSSDRRGVGGEEAGLSEPAVDGAMRAYAAALLVSIALTAAARAEDPAPASGDEGLRYIDPWDPNYRSLRAGEGFRTSLFGRDVAIEPRDRR